jgi:hypothetical protein
MYDESNAFTAPKALRQQQFMEWIERLPDSESPAWSGLPNSV